MAPGAPGAPPFDGFLQAAVQFVRFGYIHHIFVEVFRQPVQNGKPLALPLFDREGSGQVMAVFHFYGPIAGNEKPVASADRDVVILMVGSDPGFNGAKIEPRHNINCKLDRPLKTLDDAQDLPVGIVLAAAPHRKTIKQTGPAGLGLERGFKNQSASRPGLRNGSQR
ncbi:MAG: hypothetical protein P8X90_31385 [Desulfobacterales bacterium]